MDANDGASFLELTLEEEHAARNSTSLEARERHIEQAIAYEMRCLLTAPSPSAKESERIKTAPVGA